MTESAAARRFVVGLDLGTTNSALAYLDTTDPARAIRTFAVPQVTAPGQVEALETLPSFLYQPADGEFAQDALRLPWGDDGSDGVVGLFARDQGALNPGRLIASAKSWLCHAGVDRTADLLPWEGGDDVPRLSPVAVSSRYLAHYRAAWDRAFPEHPLAEQDLVVTLPASFDEVARELTVQAARQAGLPRIILIEEPQAAFYAWIAKHQHDWDQQVSLGQKILVCDVGGGTTDFTLIRVRRSAEGLVQFHRVAVGNHLILGGDNMDLAVAHRLEQQLAKDGRLEPRAWSLLLRASRRVKETLLTENAPDSVPLTIPGVGSRLIGGGTRISVDRATIHEVVAEGFFPNVPLDAIPTQVASGFQEFGLPYAADAAITRHLASFLTTHRHAGDNDAAAIDDGADPARPEIVLFNGGVFESPLLQQRVIDSLSRWFGEATDWRPLVLDHERLDLAVARGAAYYGMVRRGEGVRIAASLARGYYVGVDADPPAAVCLCAATLEPGEEVDLSSRRFEARVGQPIEFPLYTSSTRLTDAAGDVVPIDREQFTSLPPIRTTLKISRSEAAGVLPVRLAARLTELGTLDLWCHEEGGKRRWKLLFDIRAATQTDREGHEAIGEQSGFVEESLIDAAASVLDGTFAGDEAPTTLMKRLAESLGMERHEWPPALLRAIWERLFELEPGRRRSPAHEARWLNLLGYSLRPGYGFALDDWRVGESWKLLHNKLAHSSAQGRAEFWVFWRRIAGGLPGGQQQALAGPLLQVAKQAARDLAAGKKRGGAAATSPHEAAELWRLLGSLEWLNIPQKIELSRSLMTAVEKGVNPAIRAAAVWTVGRCGARVPQYGPLNLVVPVDEVARWIDRLESLPGDDPADAFAVVLLARRSGDRYRDLDDAARGRIVRWLRSVHAKPAWLTLVEEGGKLDEESQAVSFGESLPRGLRIL